MKGSASNSAFLAHSSPRLRHIEGAQTARYRRPVHCLPAVVEEGNSGPAFDSYYMRASPNSSMFDHWRKLTEQYNSTKLRPEEAREFSFSVRRRNGSSQSGRTSPALSVASADRHRTRSQMSSARLEHCRQMSKRTGAPSQYSSHSNYAGSHRGDSDPEESSSSSSSSQESLDSGEEDEDSMDEKVSVRGSRSTRRHSPSHRSHQSHRSHHSSRSHHSHRSHQSHRAERPPAYLPQPIFYQMPYYPPMPFFYPPPPPISIAPPVLPVAPSPFAAQPLKVPKKREVSTRSRPTPAPSLPKPIASTKLQVPRPDSPDIDLHLPETAAATKPVALEIGMSETKSLAEIFQEKRKDFELKASERKVAKVLHTDKTPEELRRLRKEMLKGASSVSAKDSEETLTADAEPPETERRKKEPNPELLERLATGKKAKVSKKEMLELTKKNYEALPEVVKKREEEQKRAETLQRLGQKKEYERHLQELKKRGKEASPVPL